MLYAGEQVKGLLNAEEDKYELKILEEEQAQVDQAIAEGRALESMTRGEGWQLFKQSIADAVADLKQRLTYEQDFRRIRRLQEAVKAYNSVLAFVEHKVNEGRSLEEKRDPSQEG